MRNRRLAITLLVLLAVCLLSFVVYNLPPVHARLSWRLADLRSRLYYAINPPQEVVFIPQEQQAQVEAIVQTTLAALLPSATLATSPSLTPVPTQPGPTATPQPSPTSTLSPTPIPEKVILSGIVHEYQQMNNCGPATLAMALSYWGWQGDQRDTRLFLRPNFASVDDKNVSPEEMAVFVERFTGLKALVRVGGELELLKRLLAAGFPVVIEKGFQPPKEDWMGHYEVINGYDDTRGRFIAQDSYIMADFPLPYDQVVDRWWRDFNYVYLVIYPPEREAEVLGVLGPQADQLYNYQQAAQKALEETTVLTGRDLFFAWFARGSSLVALGDYPAAAQAYDQAFAIYAGLPEEERPWRTLWYQTGPYAAYYHSGRYQDVISLANTTLSFLSQPVLEETFYWRGLAKEGLGDVEGALKDLTKAASLNPNFTLAVEALRSRGAQVP
ncbi:MAG TPA: C39 family peptidase [Anaerolineales bacterium]|nr:C39 family peptidase [Anaerolineales bacterium]